MPRDVVFGMTRSEAIAHHAELFDLLGDRPAASPAAARRIDAIALAFRSDGACGPDVRTLAAQATTWLATWCGPGQTMPMDHGRIRRTIGDRLALLNPPSRPPARTDAAPARRSGNPGPVAAVRAGSPDAPAGWDPIQETST